MNNREVNSKRTIATGVLILALCLYVIARILEPRIPWIGFVRAFSEASVVGGLADWFAVVALFRHPLGLRWIPHTAIIPNNRDRIGAALADFIQKHFLTPEAIKEKVGSAINAKKLARWLMKLANAKRVTGTLSEYLPKVVETINDEDIRRFIRDNVSVHLKKIRIGPRVAALLRTFVDEGKHQLVLTQLLLSGVGIIKKNEDFIRDKVRKRVPDLLGLTTLFGVKELIANGIINGAIQTIEEASKEMNHPIRDQFNEAVSNFIKDLETSDKYSHAIVEMREKVITSTGISDFLKSTWNKFKSEILAGLANPDSDLRQRLVVLVRCAGFAIRKDDALRDKLDKWIIYLAIKNRRKIGEMIRDQFQRRDFTTAARLIEDQVGDDLQYIRINGALVGGFVGLVLYLLDKFLLGKLILQ